jgi:hypothetical protein
MGSHTVPKCPLSHMSGSTPPSLNTMMSAPLVFASSIARSDCPSLHIARRTHGMVVHVVVGSGTPARPPSRSEGGCRVETVCGSLADAWANDNEDEHAANKPEGRRLHGLFAMTSCS